MPHAPKESGLHKRVTMQDIADAAGVHIMTVSNALGDTRKVAPKTRERVLCLARELNYIPNNSARALAGRKTGIIAVVSGAINEPYYGTMVHLVESQIYREMVSRLDWYLFDNRILRYWFLPARVATTLTSSRASTGFVM